jgi:hypothetical protein
MVDENIVDGSHNLWLFADQKPVRFDRTVLKKPASLNDEEWTYCIETVREAFDKVRPRILVQMIPDIENAPYVMIGNTKHYFLRKSSGLKICVRNESGNSFFQGHSYQNACVKASKSTMYRDYLECIHSVDSSSSYLMDVNEFRDSRDYVIPDNFNYGYLQFILDDYCRWYQTRDYRNSIIRDEKKIISMLRMMHGNKIEDIVFINNEWVVKTSPLSVKLSESDNDHVLQLGSYVFSATVLPNGKLDVFGRRVKGKLRAPQTDQLYLGSYIRAHTDRKFEGCYGEDNATVERAIKWGDVLTWFDCTLQLVDQPNYASPNRPFTTWRKIAVLLHPEWGWVDSQQAFQWELKQCPSDGSYFKELCKVCGYAVDRCVCSLFQIQNRSVRLKEPYICVRLLYHTQKGVRACRDDAIFPLRDGAAALSVRLREISLDASRDLAERMDEVKQLIDDFIGSVSSTPIRLNNSDIPADVLAAINEIRGNSDEVIEGIEAEEVFESVSEDIEQEVQ